MYTTSLVAVMPRWGLRKNNIYNPSRLRQNRPRVAELARALLHRTIELMRRIDLEMFFERRPIDAEGDPVVFPGNIVEPLGNVAGETVAPVPFATVIVHVKGVPSVVEPLTLFVLVALNAAGVTVTAFGAQVLLDAAGSAALPGSTMQTPVDTGFVNVPEAVAVAVKPTVNDPPAASVTVPPLAVQVKVEEATAGQLIVPVPPTPVIGVTVGVPL